MNNPLDFEDRGVIQIGDSCLEYRVWGRIIQTIPGSDKSVRFGWGAGTFLVYPLQVLPYVEVSIKVEENGVVFEPCFVDNNNELINTVRQQLIDQLTKMVCSACKGIGYYVDFTQRKECGECNGFGGLKYCSEHQSLHAVGACPNPKKQEEPS